MSPERWKRIKELHARALELPEGERRRFLDGECAGDEELLAEVLSLLTAHPTEGEFLEPPREEQRKEEEQDGETARLNTTLGDFELLEVIGRGGMGVVYRSRQVSLDREVAVKVLPPRVSLEQRHIERFKREAHAAARFKHPGIVPIHFVGEEDGTHYFAMEYVEGQSLHEELEVLRGEAEEKSILPFFGSRSYIPKVTGLVRSIAEALDYAHQKGVVHRDIKPRNLLLDPSGTVHVVDFGLAKVEELGSISQTGDMAGTPAYMSPEQALAKRVPIDHRTDIFSLGVVLYEMLTLHCPFEGSSSHEVLFQISFAEPRSIRRHNPRVPRDLETICQKALSKKPDGRYASAGEFAEDLRRFLDHEAIVAQRPSAFSRVIHHVSRRRSRYLPVATAVVALIVGLFLMDRWAADRQIQEKIDQLQEVVDAEDLGEWAFEELVVRLRIATDLREEGIDESLLTSLIHPAIRRIEDVFYPQIEIVSDPSLDGAVVYTQTIDLLTQELGPLVSPGVLPLERFRVTPGVYRITVVQEVGGEVTGYCELTRVAQVRGRIYVARPVIRPTSDVSEEMIRIPAGEYTVGDPEAMRPQFLERRVQHPSFLIDAREVTNGEFRAFVVDTGTPEPVFWENRYDEDWDDLPVMGVTFQQARAYAEWVGKRLPTFVEWEVGARGPEGYPYPWGDEAGSVTEQAVLGIRRQPGQGFWESYLAGIQPVGATTSDVSPFGLLDTLGNVREWTETVYLSATLQGDSVPEYPSRIAKGFSWDSDPQSFVIPVLYANIVCPTDALFGLGFRCAKTIWSQ